MDNKKILAALHIESLRCPVFDRLPTPNVHVVQTVDLLPGAGRLSLP